MSNRIRLAALVVAGATMIAASPTMAAPKVTTINVATTKTSMFKFDGVKTPLKAGTYKFVYTNSSGIGHNLKVGSMSTPTFSSGSKSITVTLKKGSVPYECSVPGHAAAGMKGTITVN
jgi:uncharacterized cupredoxin-like copper-binding protein